MTIREFFATYKEPEDSESKVWGFIINKDICFSDISDLLYFHSHMLDKEIKDFTIVNQLDYEMDTVYGRSGLKIYPKTKVFIYTTDWEVMSTIDWRD